MSTTFVNVRAVLAAGALSAIAFVAAPKSAAAQGPSGSYQKSCRVLSVREGILTASCQTTNDKWLRTSYRMSDCPRGDIANSNGRLVCVNQTEGRPVYGNRDRERDHDHDGDYDRDHDRGTGNGHAYGHGNGNGWGRGGRNQSGVVLYSGRRFSGQSMTIRQDYTNLGSTGFNDVASSVRIIGGGTWRLCSDKGYGGRCVNVSSDVSDLGRLGLGNNISSLRRVD